MNHYYPDWTNFSKLFCFFFTYNGYPWLKISQITPPFWKMCSLSANFVESLRIFLLKTQLVNSYKHQLSIDTQITFLRLFLLILRQFSKGNEKGSKTLGVLRVKKFDSHFVLRTHYEILKKYFLSMVSKYAWKNC